MSGIRSWGCGCDERAWRQAVARRRLLAAGGASALLAALGRTGVAFGQGATATPVTEAVLLDGEGGGLANGAFVHPLAEVYGDVEIGAAAFVEATALLYAAAGRRVALGPATNCQDNTYLLAETAPVTTGDRTSVAHQAVLVDSTAGPFTFFGFRARVRNAEIGAGAMVLHNAVVEHVSVPADRVVPSGARITSQADADALPMVEPALVRFKEDVLVVNRHFAEAYSALYAAEGRPALEGVTANPAVPFNPTPIRPTIGDGSRIAEFVQITGDVRLGPGSRVGQRSSIRADEGHPIVIGRRARIRSRVTFHALVDTRVDVGDNFVAGDEVVVHGPVTIGDNVTVEDGAVVYQATVEDNVVIRAGATVASKVTLREGTIVPENAVVSTQAEADALPRA